MDWESLAHSRTLDAFTAEHPHYFLVASMTLTKPKRPQRTMSIDLATLTQPMPAIAAAVPAVPAAPTKRVVLAVKKIQSTFPSMISIGRTSNNDVVIEDVQVSKFHALFRVRGAALELEDAGSVNGTRVNEDALQKGVPRLVKSGDTISFGTLKLELLDSGAAWAALRRR